MNGEYMSLETAKRLRELENRINKAIEYIRHTEFTSKGYINFCYELENILQGLNGE